MRVSRRTLLRAGAGVLAAGLAGCRGGVTPLTIAGGQEGGLYREFAERLAEAIDAAEPRLHCTPRDTDGSVANILLVGRGEADIGIAQADVTIAARAGEAPFAAAVPALAIGRVYQDYLQLVVRADAELDTVADLAGRTVSLGPGGSGTAMFGERLIEVTRLELRRRFLKLNDATAALERADIDALLWLGGVPTPALATLHGRIGIRLLPTAALLPALRARYGTVYRQATIPSGGYGPAGMATIGVANLLVCTSALTETVAAAVTRVLLERETQVVPPMALGTQFLDSRTLIGTFGVPLHPGAAAAYRDHHG